MSEDPAPASGKKPPGFWWYMGGFSGIGTGVILGPLYAISEVSDTKKEVVEARKEMVTTSTEVRILQTQFAQVGSTLIDIKASLISATDYQAERERIEKAIRSMVKDEALRK